MVDHSHHSTKKKGGLSLAQRLYESNTTGTLPVIPGLVPYLPPAEMALFEGEIRDVVRNQVRVSMGIEVSEDNRDLWMDIDREVREVFLQAVRRGHEAKLKGMHFSITEIGEVYKEVLQELRVTFIDEHKDLGKPLVVRFPDEICGLIAEGGLFAVEDLQEYIDKDPKTFAHQVSKIPLEELNPLSISYYSKLAIREFRRIYMDANIKLLDRLGLRLKDETDQQLSDRIDERISEAVKFLEVIHKSAEDYQKHKVRAWSHKREDERGPRLNIIGSPRPKDLVFKRFSDLVEIVFYANQYPLGAQRRFAAQQLMFLTLLYDYVHEVPAFKERVEVARRLNDDLNVNLAGRDGRVVAGIFMDAHGNKSLKEDEQYCATYTGVREFKLKPKIVINDARNGDEPAYRTLFPEGIWVGIDARCKSPDSTVLKFMNKGDINGVTDLVGIDIYIDNRNMPDAILRQTILDLKEYIKNMWRVSKFAQDRTGITNPERAEKDNISSSDLFRNEKVVFYVTINDTQVPVEVQFKTLEMKLAADGTDGDASHDRYKLDQFINRRAFADLFPPEIFGDFASIAERRESVVPVQIVSEAGEV